MIPAAWSPGLLLNCDWHVRAASACRSFVHRHADTSQHPWIRFARSRLQSAWWIWHGRDREGLFSASRRPAGASRAIESIEERSAIGCSLPLHQRQSRQFMYLIKRPLSILSSRHFNVVTIRWASTLIGVQFKLPCFHVAQSYRRFLVISRTFWQAISALDDFAIDLKSESMSHTRYPPHSPMCWPLLILSALNKRALRSVRFFFPRASAVYGLRYICLRYLTHDTLSPSPTCRREGEINTPQTEYLKAYK